jgi:FAD/FMN-containing dehydrogenase
MRDQVTSSLAQIVGRQHVILPEDDQEPYIIDWRGRYRGAALAVVKAGSTQEVADVVRLCAENGLLITPQGGNTGMCGAATPPNAMPAVVVRLDRMRRIRNVSPLANTITVEAGCILAEVQAAAEEAGRLFPLSLGAEGSCQIGGNIATNAGGTAVLRYGPMRELVLGLEVVLPDGRVFDGLRALRKDNTGYDLKQLFIGAEGTLGIITAAVLKLFAPPKSRALAMVALPGVEQALAVLTLLRNSVGDRLGSLEIMSRGQVELIAEQVPDVSIPFALEAAFYLLIELTDTLPNVDLRTPLENVLAEALETEVITDAILAESQSQAAALWRIRHSVSEAGKRAGYVVSHDSAVPLDGQAAFITNVERRIKEAVPTARVVMHGHIGDGNIHVLAILPPEHVADPQARQELVTRINLIVDDATHALRGAISAEHGIGLSNRARLARVTDPVGMELMRRIKAAVDPSGVMNPDKIFEPNAG